jgi:glutamine synthetase
LRNCLYAGISNEGVNAEVAPGQWEYQVGIVEGLDAADQLWVSRYLLARTAEQFGVDVNYHPKPVTLDFNGSGGHLNFSTNLTRGPGGLKYIKEHCMPKLQAKHKEHLQVYGEHNHMRLTGRELRLMFRPP